MNRKQGAGRHLDTRTALDFLENRLDAPERARAEEHLATPCSACRERMRAVAELVEVMRRDRTPEVPAALRQVAIDAFAAAPLAERAPGLLQRVAKLIFDSAATPAPAAARRAVGSSRLLRYAAGPCLLELEFEAESATEVTLRGRLQADDPALYRIDIEVGGEARTAWPDAGGAFVIERLPHGRARIVLGGPSGPQRLPGVRL
jgi:hypothetical protein